MRKSKKSDISRYNYIIKYAIREVELSEKEVLAINDSSNGTMLENVGIRIMYANIEDSIKLESLAEKWEIDGEALVNKLKKASIEYLHALADAIERYWSKNDVNNDPEIFKKIGLLK